MTAADRSPLRRLALLSVVAATLAAAAADRAWTSLVDHAPEPPALAPRSPLGPPLSPRVVLVLVDGLGEAPARELRSLAALSRDGAQLACQASPPTLSRPGRATLLTGVRAHQHGATTNFHSDRPAVGPSLLDGLQGARVWGSKLWPGLFPRGFGDRARVTRVDVHHAQHRDKAVALFAAEREAVAELIEALAEDFPLAVLDLLAVDSSSHDHGVGSPEQRAALQHVDAMLAQLAPAVLGRGATLVVTADHGHVAEGGHGGDEPEVTAVPLVLAGAGVKTGARGRCAHLDVAPTLAALLGVAPPAAAEGRVLWEALAAEPLATSPTTPQPPSEAPRARRWSSAGAAALAALGLLWLGVTAAGPGASAVFALVAAAAGAALLHLSGLRLSFSGINDEVLIVPYFTRVAAIAAGAALCGALAAGRWAGRDRLRAAGGALVAGQGALLLFAALVHARHSLLVDGPLDAIGIVFLAFAALIGSLGLTPLVLAAWAASGALERRALR
ncbi:MAG: alkaline phosphatase family protein [Vicinamibacteria bacterium]|nr:alkaline phosphatase family protein [Vicinamibacteria bacterium]